MKLEDYKENKETKIFEVSGKAESGKSYCTNLIKEYYKSKGKVVIELLFAKSIKQYANDYFNWDGLEINKPRELLQVLGTNIIREKLNMMDFHVNRVCEDIQILSYFADVIIISDCRFPNEIEILKSKFNNIKTIRMTRRNYISKLTQEQQEHISECALDNYKEWDYEISAECIEEMEYKIEAILSGAYDE